MKKEQINNEGKVPEATAELTTQQLHGRPFVVRMRDMLTSGLPAKWELIEQSWETPNVFDDQGEAELVARLLALRHDGDKAFCVVGFDGAAIVTFLVKKQLETERPDTSPLREALPPDFPNPMLDEALQAYRASRGGKEHALRYSQICTRQKFQVSL